MARGGDTRSPSPTGSYSSRRSRREEDRSSRDKRGDARLSRRRSRSPTIDRRHREREYHDSHRRGTRSPDRWDGRRDDRSYELSRRDRSRERYRSPGRLNGYRPRSRDRDNRDNRDNRDRRDVSRERQRRRGDDSSDSKNRNRADEHQHQAKDSASSSKSSVPPKVSTPPRQQTDEEKRAERLAKLEAWKQKQAAEKERKAKEQEAIGGTRSLLNELDRKAAQSPTVSSPKSPATLIETVSPAPYSGKFDFKAIAKKAATNSTSSTTLGDDVSLPKSMKSNGSVANAVVGIKRDYTGADKRLMNGNTKAKELKAGGNVTGFGLGGKFQNDMEKASKPGLDFGEEESGRKKLERLPTPPPEHLQNGVTSYMRDDEADKNDVGEEDDDDEDAAMENAETEEEAAAAARLAAERREERLLAQSNEQSMQIDIDMKNPSENDNAELQEQVSLEEVRENDAMEEEDMDPLDVFMSGLNKSATARKAPGLSSIGRRKSIKQEPEAMFGDDDDEFSTIVANPDDILGMASKNRKKKEIPTVNHSKMDYEPFRKAFYTEPTELAEMSEEALADLRLELDGIKVRGLDVPKPVQKWSQFGLGVQMLDVVQKLGFEKPTSIQSQAVPAIMSGRDVIGIAKTGSGKTIAFLLPMFRHIKDQRPLESMDGPIGLIMTPTRELATQIHKECKSWLKALNLRAVCAYGGAPIKDQIADLKRGAEIIVCTPGRMIDLLAANSGRVTNLRRVTYTVLDEADRMFDMGFEPQVMKILANIRPQRQTVLFSATFPRNMEALARKTLSKPVEIIVGGRSVVAPEIEQIVEVRSEDTKFLRLLQLLGEIHEDEDARSLIFVDRQESAEDLMNAILRKGYPCFTIHGGKDQYDRDSVISDFKAGIFPVLVATSVAARGLDVKQLKMVVNFDCPNHLEDYVHRAGRTGRAGNTGKAVTFITEDQSRYSIDVAKALKQSGQEVPEALQKLVEIFTEKVKAGKEKASASGFGGKGLEKLDQERDAARNRERKTYKTGDEGDEEDKDNDEKKEDNKEEFIVKPAGTTNAPLPGVPAGIDLDGHIKVHKTEIPPDSGESKDLMKGVSQAAAAINARLTKAGQIRGNAPIDNKGPDAGAFHATLEINDFPQKARWAVTNRTNVAKILEATGTSITTKGNFYASGSTPSANDPPKLYILVEGDTEVVVTNAMRELMRLLKEGTTAAMDSEARAPASGRYSVV